MTDKGLAPLGLNEVIHNPPSSKVIDGRIQEHTKDKQSLQNSFRQAENPNENPIDQKTRLHKELLQLLGFGFERKKICWLIAQAKRRSKRLAHVVKAIWHRIHILNGKHVMGYINAMLTKDLDYAWIARHTKAEASQEYADRKDNELLESLNESFHSAKVFDSKGVFVGVLSFQGKAYLLSYEAAGRSQ